MIGLDTGVYSVGMYKDGSDTYYSNFELLLRQADTLLFKIQYIIVSI